MKINVQKKFALIFVICRSANPESTTTEKFEFLCDSDGKPCFSSPYRGRPSYIITVALNERPTTHPIRIQKRAQVEFLQFPSLLAAALRLCCSSRVSPSPKALHLQPSALYKAQKSGKPGKSIFRVQKYPFPPPSWDPFKWPFSGTEFPLHIGNPRRGGN